MNTMDFTPSTVPSTVPTHSAQTSTPNLPLTTSAPSLTTLPVEIRLVIFHYVLLPHTDTTLASPPTHSTALTIHPGDSSTPELSSGRFWGSPAMSTLFTLCRTIHADLHTLIYASSTFVLAPTTSPITPTTPSPQLLTPRYTERLSPSLRGNIRHLDIRIPLYIRSIRDAALKLCAESHTQLFPTLRSAVLRVQHISFASNPLAKYRAPLIVPLLECFAGVDSISLHCHESRFFSWAPAAHHTTERLAKFDVVESWQTFSKLPGGANLYRAKSSGSAIPKTSQDFGALCDDAAFERVHARRRPSVLAMEGMAGSMLEGVDIALKSAKADGVDRAMLGGSSGMGRRRVRF